MRRAAGVVLGAVLGTVLLVLTSAQPSPLPGDPRGLSAASPLARHLSAHPALRAQTRSLHALLRALAALVDARAAHASPLACNLRAVPWLFSAEALLRATGLPGLNDACRTRVDASSSGDDAKHLAADAAPALAAAADAHAAAASAFVKGFRDWQGVDWPRGVFAVAAWDVRRRAQRCRIEAAVALRVAGVWYARAAATNRPVDAFMPDGDRALVTEFVALGSADALSLPARWADGLRNATTTVTLAGGKAGPAAMPMALDDNPALTEALRLNDGAVDQARDAVTPSNIAILALPMAMSLVPVAFVADLNMCATLLYIVLTDVLSCLPFLIKGAELVASGSIERGDVVAYHIGTPHLGLMEVWAASCHGDDRFRVLGYIFIAVALLAIAVGVLLEFVASRVMHERRRRLRMLKLTDESIGPFGNALLVPSRPDDDFSDDELADGFAPDNDQAPPRWRHALCIDVPRRPRSPPADVVDRPFPEPGVDIARFGNGHMEEMGWWSRRRCTRNGGASAKDWSERGFEDDGHS